jgi:hypothetical protein
MFYTRGVTYQRSLKWYYIGLLWVFVNFFLDFVSAAGGETTWLITLQLRFAYIWIEKTSQKSVYSLRNCQWKLFWAFLAFPLHCYKIWRKNVTHVRCSLENHGSHLTRTAKNICWEAGQRVVVLTGLTQKIAILWHLLAESCTTDHSWALMASSGTSGCAVQPQKCYVNLMCINHCHTNKLHVMLYVLIIPSFQVEK